MSQSELHKELIIDTVRELQYRFPNRKYYVDGVESLGYERPLPIRRFIPDIYSGKTSAEDELIIAEAKTDYDFDSSRSTLQISAFLNYLEDSGNGLFVLSVSGRVADFAKSHLCLICNNLNIVNTEIILFDTLDFWILSSRGGYSWRLY